jgi:hypothetical protein
MIRREAIKLIGKTALVVSIHKSSCTKTVAPAPPTAYPSIPAGFFFKSDHYWNIKLPGTPEIDPQSDAIIAHYNGAGTIVYGECTMPYNVVNSKTQPLTFVKVMPFGGNADYHDPATDQFPNGQGLIFQNGPYAADPNVDHHLLVADLATNRLYETYQLRQDSGAWVQEGCAFFQCDAEVPRQLSVWEASSDAAGFAVLPGLIRRDEILRGVIPHALRITVRQTIKGYVAPATHGASNPNAPVSPLDVPMGAQFWLKKTPSIQAANYDQYTAPIITCLQDYGAYVADNGTNFGLSASFENLGPGDFPQFFKGYRSPDPTDNGTFHLTDNTGYDIQISDFELIKMGPVQPLR